MNDLNIHKDSRNRGLEVLLYHPEKVIDTSQNEIQKFKLSFTIPFFSHKEFTFHFEFFMRDTTQHSESK